MYRTNLACSLPWPVILFFLSAGFSQAFESIDIGTQTGGTTQMSGADGMEIEGSGNDVYDSSDGCRFVYKTIKGDFDVRARVSSIQNTNDWAKAGLMARQSNNASSVQAMVCLSQSHGVTFQWRPKSGAITESGWPAAAPSDVWLRLVRGDGQIAGYMSVDDGAKWTMAATAELKTTDTLLVGMFVTSHNDGTLCKAKFRKISFADPVERVAGDGDGLKGTYFNSDDLTGQSITRLDSTVNFNWGLGSPDPAIREDHFTARWEGEVQAQFSETYTFYLLSDDGARLWVDGRKLIDNWVEQPATEVSGSIKLEAGKKYAIRVEYWESTKDALVSLRWSSESTLKQIIPKLQLYSGTGGTDTLTATQVAPDGSAQGPATPDAGNRNEYKPIDSTLASAYAASAAKMVAEHKLEKAEYICFKALANDENCGDALYVLGTVYEAQGKQVAAQDFLLRACRELAGNEKNDAGAIVKRLDAERRVRSINPYAERFSAGITDYARELGAILKKYPDSLARQEVMDRLNMLRLHDLISPDKLPQVGLAPVSKTTASAGIAPDIERALKLAGWTKISGSWKKMSENVYEVTDGKLQADYANGALQVLLHKGGTGTLKATVRNEFSDYSSSDYYGGYGFGVVVKGNGCKLYTPNSGSFFSSRIRSMYDREISLPGELPKYHVLVSINEGNLDIAVNGKKEHRSNYKLSKEGAFVIEIDGTMTIEQPMAKAGN